MNYEDMSDFEINKKVAGVFLSCDYIFDEGSKRVELANYQDVMIGYVHDQVLTPYREFNPCNNPSDAWPVIFENKIATEWFTSDLWRAQCDNQFQPGEFKVWTSYCYKPLRAAMICFLKMKDAEK